MSKPKVIAVIALGLVVLAGTIMVVINATHGNHGQSRPAVAHTVTPTTTPATPKRSANEHAPTPTAPTMPDEMTNAVQMSTMILEPPGTVETPGATATLPIATADHDIAYIAATVTAPTKAGTSSSGNVYAMKVSVRLLITYHQHPAGVALDRGDLEDFTILSHPGADPLAPVTEHDRGCQPLPTDLPAMKVGDTLTWCITVAGTIPAAGGQYAAAAGPYQRPITWLADDTDTIH